MSPRLELTVASGEPLDVREFLVTEHISALFEISVVFRSDDPDIDFETIVGQPAAFVMRGGAGMGQLRGWTGVCKELRQIGVEERGLSTYELSIVPVLWLLTQRRNHRMFQQKSELDIVTQILGEWNIEPVLEIAGTYKKRKYRVQYGESDFTFLSRMLEDAGITFYFRSEGGETRLVLADRPHAGELRTPLSFRETPTDADMEHVTKVRIGRRIRPGKYTMRDHDYRRPASYKLLASAKDAQGVEEKLERFHYTPGSFLFESDKGESTPNADDRGKFRTDEGEGNALAQKRLEAKRATAKSITFETNTIDLAPGSVVSFLDHPRSDLGAGARLLVISSGQSGTSNSEWSHRCEAVVASSPYRPPLLTPKPKATGVESATVVGPAGEEIHTDEFGRVRVHFHWDRESALNEQSSCWIHVSHPWGGAGYGGSNLPRIGQEVIVDFLGGDPDRPIIIGRVYTNLQKTPYKLPDNKTQSGWKSSSSPQTGGYNEMMFEDAAGKELLRMQAERDLTKLVKHDESVSIGNDRSKVVGRDDRHTVARDRSRSVGRDEQVTIGRDSTRLVKNDEAVTVGHDLSKLVKNNEREITGMNRTVTVGVNRATQVGAIDSLTVGATYALSVSPPGEGGGPTTSQVIVHDKIVFSTPGGASITMEGDTIKLDAKNIYVSATSFLGAVSSGEGIFGGGKKAHFGSGSGKVTINGNAGTDVNGTTVNVQGGPMVFLNPAGALFAGRVTDAAPDQIIRGAATVLEGGPQFPYDVRKLPDGRIQVGNHIFIEADPRRPNFQAEALAAMGVMSTTPSGQALLSQINSANHDMRITYFDELNGKCSWYDGGSDPARGSNAIVQWNPDYQSPNPLDPDNLPGSDSTLFHEMNHGNHALHGTADNTASGDNWDTNEERNTINDTYPAENDYLADRGYPYARPDHRTNMVPADQRPGPNSTP